MPAVPSRRQGETKWRGLGGDERVWIEPLHCPSCYCGYLGKQAAGRLGSNHPPVRAQETDQVHKLLDVTADAVGPDQAQYLVAPESLTTTSKQCVASFAHWVGPIGLTGPRNNEGKCQR